MSAISVAGIGATPDLVRQADLQRLVEMAQLAGSASVLRVLSLEGDYAGYLALVPGEPGFAHLSLYLTPAARACGRGWQFCRELPAWCERVSADAVAVHPTNAAQVRLCAMLGLEYAAELPPRGPVFVVTRGCQAAQCLPAEAIARAAYPRAFAVADVLVPAYRRLGLSFSVPLRRRLERQPREGTPAPQRRPSGDEAVPGRARMPPAAGGRPGGSYGRGEQ